MRITRYAFRLFVVLFCSLGALGVAAGEGIVIGGFDGSRSSRPFSGDVYENIRSRLADPGNFGPAGVVENPVIFAPDVSTADAASLAGLDIFVITEVSALSGAEAAALQDFVLAGGSLLLQSDSSAGGTVGIDVMLQTLDGGAVDPPAGGSNGADAGNFIVDQEGPFGNLMSGDTFSASLGSTLTVGSATAVLGRTDNNTFDILAEIPRDALGGGSGSVLAATDPLFSDFFVPPSTISFDNENNATFFLNWVAQAGIPSPLTIEIPTLDTLGMAAFAAVLLLIGGTFLRRRA